MRGQQIKGGEQEMSRQGMAKLAVSVLVVGGLLAMTGCEAKSNDHTDDLDRAITGSATRELAVSALPGAPAGASLVVVCPYTPSETVIAEFNKVAPGPEYDKVKTSDSDAETLWHWVTPTRGVVETWHVARTVDPCSAGGVQLATGFVPDDRLRFSQHEGRWVLQQ